MAITITTLNNEAASAKTFTEIAADRAVHEWLNTTDYTTTFDQRLFVKQQLAGKNRSGIPMRRSLVSAKLSVPALDGAGKATGFMEEVTVNLTVLSPTSLSVITLTNQKDLVAYIRNLCTASVVAQLIRGEV